MATWSRPSVLHSLHRTGHTAVGRGFTLTGKGAPMLTGHHDRTVVERGAEAGQDARYTDAWGENRELFLNGEINDAAQTHEAAIGIWLTRGLGRLEPKIERACLAAKRRIARAVGAVWRHGEAEQDKDRLEARIKADGLPLPRLGPRSVGGGSVYRC